MIMSNDNVDIRSAITPKSDQLNADDLLGGTMTITVKSVKSGSLEQPVIIEIEGGRPYKPCKSMIRVLWTAWGENAKAWHGRSMTLYRDDSVTWAGEQTGGIRISHLSDIEDTLKITMAQNRKKKITFIIKKMLDTVTTNKVKMYGEKEFTDNYPAIVEKITSGIMVADDVIKQCEKRGKLTQKQIDTISSIKKVQ